jgi:hypothetical protein
MAFVLTAHYIALTDIEDVVRQGQEFRVTGFDFKGNVVLTLAGAETKVLLSKTADNFFVRKTDGLDLRQYIPPDKEKFRGILVSDVAGFYEGQKTTLTCWASSLSNALMTLQTTIFVSEHDILNMLNATAATGGPNHEQYVEAMEEVIRSHSLALKVSIHEAGIERNWAPMLDAVSGGRPVIISVRKRSHVVILLGFTPEKPNWIMYFEPTGGSFKKVSLDRFLLEHQPDWAYSFS